MYNSMCHVYIVYCIHMFILGLGMALSIECKASVFNPDSVFKHSFIMRENAFISGTLWVMHLMQFHAFAPNRF